MGDRERHRIESSRPHVPLPCGAGARSRRQAAADRLRGGEGEEEEEAEEEEAKEEEEEGGVCAAMGGTCLYHGLVRGWQDEAKVCRALCCERRLCSCVCSGGVRWVEDWVLRGKTQQESHVAARY